MNSLTLALLAKETARRSGRTSSRLSHDSHLFGGSTKGETGQLPLPRNLAKRPLVVVFDIRNADLGIGHRGGGIARHGDTNVRMLGENGIGGKNDIHVAIADRLPHLPGFVVAGIIGRAVRIGDHSIAGPHSLQAIDVLLNDRFAFRVDQLLDGFFIIGRNRGGRPSNSRARWRRGRNIVEASNNAQGQCDENREK